MLLPKKMPLHTDVKVDDLAEAVMSGGLIKNVILQAARLAVSEEVKKVEKRHFVQALERIKKSQNLMGKKRLQSEDVEHSEEHIIQKSKDFFAHYGSSKL